MIAWHFFVEYVKEVTTKTTVWHEKVHADDRSSFFLNRQIFAAHLDKVMKSNPDTGINCLFERGCLLDWMTVRSFATSMLPF